MLGFKYCSQEKEQTSLKKWLIPELEQGKDKMSLEHPDLSESKKVPKER